MGTSRTREAQIAQRGDEVAAPRKARDLVLDFFRGMNGVGFKS
jgi:hypothetical protein